MDFVAIVAPFRECRTNFQKCRLALITSPLTPSMTSLVTGHLAWWLLMHGVLLIRDAAEYTGAHHEGPVRQMKDPGFSPPGTRDDFK